MRTLRKHLLLSALVFWLAAFAPLVRAADAPLLVVQADFSVDAPAKIMAPADAASAVFTTDPTERVGGKRSLKADSRASTQEWNEFFHSKPGLFPPKEAYKIAFDYKILSRDPNTQFYALLRRVGDTGSGQDWTDWSKAAGQSGHAEISFVRRDRADYVLILGIQHGGAASVNNLTVTTDPANRPIYADWSHPPRTWNSPGSAAYYADSVGGSDAADGLSPKHPWRSLSRINSGVFGPGDRIFLKAGSRWAGFLAPGGSGAAGKPIVVSRYGSGPKPAIDAAGAVLATVSLTNGEYWDIGSLDIANQAPSRIPSLTGVKISLEDFGVAHDIYLHDLSIHDVMGSNVKDEGGGNGICCTNVGRHVKTCYDGLLIERCHLVRTDRNGITMWASSPRRECPLSTHVVIRDNLLEDIGGDGIVPIGCDGCIVAHNVLRGGRVRAQDYAAGIWPWACDNTVVEYNEVSGMKGTNDGEGYDSDYDCRNSLFQYNFSHGNDGGFMLICDDGSQGLPTNLGNTGTVIRYNLSVNDGLHTFNITGPCRNTQIYNNVFYLSKGLDIPFVNGGNWGGGWPSDTHFVNNVFDAVGKASFHFGGMTGTTFDHNSYWGDLAARPADPNALLSDPQFSTPGSLDPKAYRPRPVSPLRRAGTPVTNNGGCDFWGNSLPVGDKPDIGIGQVP